jgi:signal-transduction protein with cAMP-binding, CBS, and nucleotidyltransferase domain
MHAPAAALVGPAAGVMGPPPPALPPEASLREALAAMAEAGASCVLAVDGEGRPVGILTERDVARRVAFRLPPEAPLSAAMTAPVIACGAVEGLWRAVATLRAHGLRHLPVLDAAGRAVGLLHRAEALAAASGRLLAHLDALAGGPAEVKSAQAGVASALLAEGLAATEVVALVNGINLELHARLLERVLAEAPPLPVPFTVLLMGSLGRGESLLRPDQDNGFLLADYPDAAHGTVDPPFRRVAEAWCLALDAAGFPLCRGGVMAMNPLWRKTASQWREQFSLWARRRSGAATLFADIFLDFRAGWGDAAPAEVLRRHVSAVLEAQPALPAALAAQDSRLGVGLTLFGGFADDEPGPGTRTDLKLHGLMPLAAAARLAAARAGVAETGTAARIGALAARGVLGREAAARLDEAFALLLDLVLRQQLSDHAAGRPPGNLVDTHALPAPVRAALRDGLRAVRGFARDTFADASGRIW